MSERNGDKARFEKTRKKRLLHRENMRRATHTQSAPSAGARTKSPSKSG